MTIRATREFVHWLDQLRDLHGRARVQARIQRLATGNPGSFRRLKQGVRELKVDVGPGYRVYYVARSTGELILLCGGSKSTQQADIKTAYALAKGIED